VAYRYDLAARLAQVSDWSSQTTSYLYNDVGQPLTVILPNGVTYSFGYDNAERLTGITHQEITQALGCYAYALDTVENQVGVTETLLVPGTGVSTTAISYGTGAVVTYTNDA
jgi:YD repeat-containing protein